MSNEQRKQTEGEYLVGASFNPSNSSAVDEIKNKTASLIDLLFAYARHPYHTPGAREAAIAIESFEAAAMWAVKAVTKQPRD